MRCGAGDRTAGTGWPPPTGGAPASGESGRGTSACRWRSTGRSSGPLSSSTGRPSGGWRASRTERWSRPVACPGSRRRAGCAPPPWPGATGAPRPPGPARGPGSPARFRHQRVSPGGVDGVAASGAGTLPTGAKTPTACSRRATSSRRMRAMRARSVVAVRTETRHVKVSAASVHDPPDAGWLETQRGVAGIAGHGFGSGSDGVEHGVDRGGDGNGNVDGGQRPPSRLVGQLSDLTVGHVPDGAVVGPQARDVQGEVLDCPRRVADHDRVPDVELALHREEQARQQVADHALRCRIPGWHRSPSPRPAAG